VPCAPLEVDERSIREILRNHMTRHVPPAQASPEQIVFRAEVFAITGRNGKVTRIREYIDTQALGRASEITPRAPRA